MNSPLASIMLEQTEWMDWAECRKYDGHAMFPREDDRDGIAYAKSICAGCPVMAECLDSAQERGERWGVWGGLTSEERKHARRRARRRIAVVAAAGVETHSGIQDVRVVGGVL